MNKYEIVKEIFDQWDPLNFMSHAPEDEYDQEISDITMLLPNVKLMNLHTEFIKYVLGDLVQTRGMKKYIQLIIITLSLKVSGKR